MGALVRVLRPLRVLLRKLTNMRPRKRSVVSSRLPRCLRLRQQAARDAGAPLRGKGGGSGHDGRSLCAIRHFRAQMLADRQSTGARIIY